MNVIDLSESTSLTNESINGSNSSTNATIRQTVSASNKQSNRLNSQDPSSHCYNTTNDKGSALSSLRNIWPNLKLGTWNIRGCNTPNKRKNIDEYLSMQQFGLIALQETKLTCRTCDTKHYKWILGKDNNQSRTSRGLAFLIHTSCQHLIHAITKVTYNILACEVQNAGDIIIVVNVHIPQGPDGVKEFDSLKRYASSHSNTRMIILGDFNAQIGQRDLTADDYEYIGPNLYHEICNDNGDELKN